MEVASTRREPASSRSWRRAARTQRAQRLPAPESEAGHVNALPTARLTASRDGLPPPVISPPFPRLDARICASATTAPFLQSRRAETRELLTSDPPGRDGSSCEPDQ